MMTPRLNRFFFLALVPIATIVKGGTADSIVPLSWNVAPMTSGAYLESFDAALPVWAGRVGNNSVTNEFPSMSGSSLPARSNAWFGTNSRVLKLETDGDVVTNTVSYQDGSSVSFADKPVYVDMRMRFDAMPDGPDSSLLTDAKLALFVSADCKLVAVHAAGWTTNDTVLDTNRWYQVTVKMVNGTFSVRINDQAVFSDLGLRNLGAEYTMKAANFYGTGLVDDLYVSHGDPSYSVAGPTAAIPALPAAGAHPPSDQEQTRINAWLAAKGGITSGTVLSMTQDQLSQAYLMGELGGDASTATPVSCTFGISKLEMASPTLLQVTAFLATSNGEKNGTINGKIQLQGKVAIGDGWTTLSGAITPNAADFTNGKATYTYAIPAGGYQFFRPLIVP